MIVVASSVYDYVMDKVDIEQLLDYYSLEYTLRDNVAWLCCPFHNETEASFTFNLETKIYGCWGCKVKGNPFTFVRDYELLVNGKELSYYDSMIRCCNICKIRINLSYKERLQEELENMDDISDIINNEISDVNSSQQETFLDSAIKKYYVKKSNYMVDKGYPKDILEYLEMGFCSGDAKDSMNNRCVFPVRNEFGKLVGWTGRAILSDAKIKWFHAPPKRFQKSLNLYNIDKALPHIYEQGCVNVVESVGNTIRMLESGRYNTVATLGSTISVEQCNMLMSYGVDIIFWYDWDKGGFEGIELALDYITNYDILSVAITDYGVNERTGKSLDLGDVSVAEVNNTKVVSVYEYISIMKGRFVSVMDDSFEKDIKIKLTDGTSVLCTNKLNTKLEMPQLIPTDVDFFKSVDSYFGVKELTMRKE